ncbi:serine hydrolase domain-containing protein [Massilia endophytica]|uniref:serine hydrolase domain-containing protein n=1 Tax=Massilia endophytica TaxID=2899220 RepID=UPI001E391F32|nr:serine hydrolase domain-containing protein [Massilia endophytica]UGQ44642.1 beta-lactamase family protein [Massilia endophytica]
MRTNARLLAIAALLAAHSAAFGADDALAKRIANVEQGLQPAVAIQGAPVQRKTLAEEMARLGVPGVSVAVIHAGEIEWAKGYGVVTPGGAAVTPNTLFQAASISKPVTAMAALKMVENGALALDRDINAYTGLWRLPRQYDDKPVTLRQLLSHTGGVTVHGFPGYAAGKPVPTLMQILNGAPPANTRGIQSRGVPGSKWQYSGGGYEVLQYIMAERSGVGFTQLLRDTVLTPLGMKDSTYAQPLPAELLANAALPHDREGKPVPGGPHTYPEQAAAGLWSTPSDLARFAIETRRSAAGQSNRVLSQSMSNLMLAPVMDNYGLGFYVEGAGQQQGFGHSGSNEGYRCAMTAYTERGDGVIVMTNGERGGELLGAIIRAVAAEYDWPTLRTKVRESVPVSAAALDALPGSYEAGAAGGFAIARAGNGLTIAFGKGTPETLYAGLGGVYFITSRDTELRFDGPNNSGRLTSGTFTAPITPAKR